MCVGNTLLGWQHANLLLLMTPPALLWFAAVGQINTIFCPEQVMPPHIFPLKVKKAGFPLLD